MNLLYAYIAWNCAIVYPPSTHQGKASISDNLAMSFSALGLSEALVKTVAKLNYTQPSPIQIEAIPLVLSQQDLIAIAQTGSGKTASFVLPILQLLTKGPSAKPMSVRALIIAPTRELAAQIHASVEKYACDLDIRSTAVFGGVRIEPQKFELQQGVDLLVATPGRLLDLHSQKALSFDDIDIFVLDEADRMLDLGFIENIQGIQSLLPDSRQNLLFSATFSKAIKSLAKGMLNEPALIELAAAGNNIEGIKQTLHPVDKARKNEVLIHLINTNNWQQILVFIKTKREADHLRDTLEARGIHAESIHANRTQRARTLALDGFRDGSIKVLVATDIASRGIDINQLPCVINYNLPFVPEDYVHRIGRTGRASANGVAISLFSDDESKQLTSIEKLIGRQFKREILAGFEPSKKAPAKIPVEDLYGNFEADNKPRGKGKSRRRGKHR